MLTKAIKRCVVISAASLFALAGINPALAATPEVLDRVPANAAMVGVLGNLQNGVAKAEGFTKSLNLPMAGDEGPFNQMKALLSLPGLNKDGSAAFFILPGADGTIDFDSGEAPDMLALIPVSDFAAFSKALNATGTDGALAVEIEGEEQFIKDAGQGFAILGPSKLVVGAFEAKTGNSAKHTKSLGTVGSSMLDSSDAAFFVDMAVFKPVIDQAIEGMNEQAEMMSAMAGAQGDQAKAGIQMIQKVMSGLSRDGQTGMFFLHYTETGVKLDLAAQFKEGSELAGYFANSGASGAYLSKIPAGPFLFAGAIDTKVAGVKKMLKGIAETNAKAAADAGESAAGGTIATMLAQAENVDGYAFTMGANPAAMMGGGLLTNTSAFIATSNPAGYLAATKEALTGMNGTKIAGMTYTTSYKSKGVNINGVDIDTWTSAIEPDPNDPNGMQVQMIQSMIFGPGGMGGMHAVTEGGLISTMSQNTPLMTSAIEAAKTSKGLADDALLKETQKGLPQARIFEFYLGTKPILDSVASVMAMVGGAADFTVPAQISPIALAGSAANGGMAFHIFMPNDAMKALADVAKSMQAADGGDDEMDDVPADDNNGGANPRF